jgi:hypothetical protein
MLSMKSSRSKTAQSQYNILDPAPHTLYKCHGAAEFRMCLEGATGRSLQELMDDLIDPEVPRALYSVGSIPLGMGTRGSDVDLILLVDGKEALANQRALIVNDSQRAVFVNETDPLIIGNFLRLHQGILVEVQVAITSAIRAVYDRLRRRSPELSETEIRTLGRLRKGWLLWETENYLGRSALNRNDRTLEIYCCTKNFVTALTHQRKAQRTLELEDFVLTLQLGRASVEMAYLAYFASEGYVYLGAKWLAQLGFAHGAHDKLTRYPLLKDGLHLLFPEFSASGAQAEYYLSEVSEFLKAIRNLIEQQMPFRIAFKACAQIAAA